MESVIFNYSEFFNDDGGFDKVRRDFEQLGDDLIKKANEIKSKIKLFDLNDLEGIKDLEDQTELLTKAFKKYGEAKVDLKKVEDEFLKAQKKTKDSQEDQVEALVKLDKKLRKHRDELNEVNTLLKVGAKTERDLTKERVEAQLNIKKTNAEIRKLQKEVLKSNELSAKEKKLLEAKLILQKEEVRNREELRERLKALRIVVDQLDFEKEADKIRKYNQEIDELTEVLANNSDKFIQSKINIGNYEESIVNALKEVQFFSGDLGILNIVVTKLVDTIVDSGKKTDNNTKQVKKNTKETKENTKAKKENAKATQKVGNAADDTGKKVNRFSKILKASGIFLLLTLAASIGAAFSKGRAGVVLTEKAMARFGAISKVVLETLIQFGKGLFKLFGALYTSVSNFFSSIRVLGLEIKSAFLNAIDYLPGVDTAQEIAETNKQIKELNKNISESGKKNVEQYKKAWDDISKSVTGFSQRVEDAKKAIKTLDEGIIRRFEIADEIRKAELNIIKLRKQVQLLEMDSTDSTRSLRDQLESTDELLEKRIQLLKEEAKIGRKQLELANAKARADAEAAGFRLSEDDVEFAKQLLDLNIRLSERKGENTLDDNLLEESQVALRNYLELLDEVEIAEAEIAKQRREIERDLFEQNLDLLIDLIDTEKNLSEQFVNDINRNFQSRIKEFNSFVVKFKENAQKQLDEFTQYAEKTGRELKFDIQFNNDGSFDVLINGAKITLDNIKELNKELQSLGLAEIPINRFREFVVEARNAVKDFKELNRELKLVAVNINEMIRGISISKDEMTALEQLEERILKLVDASRGKISKKERESILKQIEELEKQKAAIVEFAEFQRKRSRIDAIDEELALVEYESERYFELLQERLDLEKELREKSLDEILQKTKQTNEKALKDYQKFGNEVRRILDTILDKVVEIQQKRVQEAEKRVDKQEELVERQRERAQQGLQNTLAFEQRELAKREADKIKQEQRQQRLEKIRALYSSYSNYASRGEQNPIVKALRDFAILEAITASFGDGGIVEDKLPTNGIFRGRSHQGRNGGIPILVEGREGIFSAREMENIGKDNFYKMKNLASMGKFDSNFFNKQRKSFVEAVPVPMDNSKVIKELQEVKTAIQNKPVSNWDVYGLTNGILDLIHTEKTNNKTTRNHFKVKKRKI